MTAIETRENLVESTRDLLWERGYAATSPRAILDRAGVGQGSMYHHFAGKEALAKAAFERSAEAVLARVSDVFDTDGSALDRIEAYLLLPREVLRGCAVGRMAGDADVLAADALHEVLTGTFAQLQDHVVRVVDEAVRGGELPSQTVAAELAATVLAVVQGGYVLARAAGDPEAFDRAVRGAVAMLRNWQL